MNKVRSKIRPTSTSLLATLVFVFAFLYASKAQTPTPPYLSLETSEDTYYIGETFTAEIKIHTDNIDTNAADAVINYDAADLEVLSLNEGSIYESYPGKEVDDATGTIKLTGYSSSNPFNSGNSDATFGTIQFRVLQEASPTNVSFDFTLGDTTESNIVDTDDNDILNAVLNGSYSLEQDSEAPYIESLSPSSSESNVNVDENIVFHIKDPKTGVDISTVEVDVNGTTYTSSGAHQFSYSGSEADYAITINPESNFDYGETVNVSVDASDLASPVNNMSTYEYSFSTEQDESAPTTYGYNPAEGESSISADSDVSFHIKDETRAGVDGVGVDISTLEVEVDGITYASSGTNVFSYSGDSSDYLITINPTEDFDEFKLINVIIRKGADINGNVMDSKSYSFSVNDISAPYTSSHNPAKRETGINLDSNISFHILDADTGVDIDSVVVSVEGVEYSTSKNSSYFSYQGSLNDYLVTVDPIEEFEDNNLAIITINGADQASSPNSMKMEAYAIIKLECPID